MQQVLTITIRRDVQIGVFHVDLPSGGAIYRERSASYRVFVSFIDPIEATDAWITSTKQESNTTSTSLDGTI